jgi:membrane fusion protein, multidrug efflux system
MPERLELESEQVQPSARAPDRGRLGAEPPEASVPKPRGRRRVFLIGAVVVLAAVGLLLYRHYAGWESTDDAQIDGHIHPISARIPGHVVRVNVDDNQYVEAGAVLVELDPTDYQVAIERAKADMASAEAAAQAAHVNVPVTSVNTSSQVSMADASVESAQAAVVAAAKQAQAAQAKVEEAQANDARAQADLARYAQLVTKQEVSQQQYDLAVATAKSTAAALAGAQAGAAAAEQQVQQARGRLAEARAQWRSTQTGPQQVAMTRSHAEAAVAQVEQARAMLQQAELNLQYTKITAPISGIVGKRSVQPGQNVQPGQDLMAIVPTEDIWVTANFKETQLESMRPGDSVIIHVDAYGRDYRGHVDSIAGATGAQYSLLPPENATGNYVKVVQRVPVKIVFDPGQDPNHLLRVGLSVEPKVKVQ